MQIFWTPEPARRPADGAFAPRSRLGRFLGISTVAHGVAAAVAAWLSLTLGPPAPDERLLVRTVDFVEPAPAPRTGPAEPGRFRASGGLGAFEAPRSKDPAVAGGPASPAPRAREASPRRPAAAPPARTGPRAVAASKPPVTAPKAETPPPATAKAEAPAPPPAQETAAAVRPSDVGDLPAPTPSPEEARIARATPRSVGGVADARSRGPASVSVPSVDAAAATTAAPAAVAVSTAGVGGDGGPVPTVAVPRELVRGAGSGTGSGGASAGSGTGTGGTRDGVAGGGGGGTGLVDMRDPDFSEYFRLIERRVRASWKFPESLGGTTQTVKIGFALGPEGSLRDVRVVSSSSGTLNDSALAAMKRAAPFPPLPEKFRRLAGQPLVLSFTVTIR